MLLFCFRFVIPFFRNSLFPSSFFSAYASSSSSSSCYQFLFLICISVWLLHLEVLIFFFKSFSLKYCHILFQQYLKVCWYMPVHLWVYPSVTVMKLCVEINSANNVHSFSLDVKGANALFVLQGRGNCYWVCFCLYLSLPFLFMYSFVLVCIGNLGAGNGIACW